MRLDLVLAPVRREWALVWLWMAEAAASAVGAISSGAGMGAAVRCFLFLGCCSFCSSSSLLEVDDVEDSSSDMIEVYEM